MDLTRLAAKLFYIRKNINSISWELIKGNKRLQELALDLNRKQLLEGQDSRENPLGNYSQRHATRRANNGLQTSHIDLKFSGAFQDAFEIKEGEEPDEIFRITSSNSKRDDIVKGLKYREGFGEDIFGLTPENLEIFKREFNPLLKERISFLLNA
jgi:hypothetical protein